jgi:D-glycero-alpha-D-manno-heptose 1-phosphate guanylyltransferase
MEAVVLAGGFGTRLRSVVSDVPKPMAPVNGRPFLELLLEYWIRQGVQRFVLSIGYLAEKISGHFGRQWGGVEIAYALETEPLGTGGGVMLAAAQATHDELLVLNGDTFFAVDLATLSSFHRESNADCTFSLFRTSDTKRYMGLALDGEGRVVELASAGSNLGTGGVILLNSKALRALPWKPGERASLEADMLPEGQRRGWRICGREFAATFIDIGVPEDYRRAPEVLKA